MHCSSYNFVIDLKMSLQTQLEAFRNNSRLVYNDRFIGDQGAQELASFIADHRSI